MICKIYNLGLLALILIIISSYFGKYFWLCEILSNFKIYYILASIIFLIASLILKNKTFILLLAAIMIESIAIYQSYNNKSPMIGNSEVYEELTLLQFNTYYLNTNYDQIVNYIENNNEKLDVVFLMEVTQGLKDRLQKIEKYYPYKITINDRWFEFAFYSKIPILSHEVKFFNKNSKDKNQYFDKERHYLIANLETKKLSIPITFYGIHTSNPLTKNFIIRNNELKVIAEEISQNTHSAHKILAGDFNTTPFSYWFKLLEKTTNLRSAERGYPIKNSWPSWLKFNLLRISIDHSLISDNIIAKERIIGEDLNSDHLPVILKLKILN